MSRPDAPTADQAIETWEVVIAGTIWVHQWDRREGRYTQNRVGGTGSKKLYISVDDRKFNQESMPDENQHLDPFTNGSLRLVASASRDETLKTRFHLTDPELSEVFEVKGEDDFREALEEFVVSELMMRRLAALSESAGTGMQQEVIKEIVTAKWPIGGTQRTIQEMLDAGERIGATTL